MDNDCALLEALHEAWAALGLYLLRRGDCYRGSCAARVAEVLKEAAFLVGGGRGRETLWGAGDDL